MQTLYKPRQYPNGLSTQISRLPPMAIEIANRWALGWPKQVKALVASGEYLDALKAQEQTERELLSKPGNGHLARHEVVQEYGLSLSPPEATTTAA